MRVDLPQCGFHYCRFQFDGNCTSTGKYEKCEYRYLSEQIERERKNGKWIEVDDDLISGRCSECGWEAHLYEDDVVGMDYCPNCGSYNVGEQDD